jgi:hypothetical protein
MKRGRVKNAAAVAADEVMVAADEAAIAAGAGRLIIGAGVRQISSGQLASGSWIRQSAAGLSPAFLCDPALEPDRHLEFSPALDEDVVAG